MVRAHFSCLQFINSAPHHHVQDGINGIMFMLRKCHNVNHTVLNNRNHTCYSWSVQVPKCSLVYPCRIQLCFQFWIDQQIILETSRREVHHQAYGYLESQCLTAQRAYTDMSYSGSAMLSVVFVLEIVWRILLTHHHAQEEFEEQKHVECHVHSICLSDETHSQ